MYQLIEVFNTIPSWPKGLQGVDPQTQSTQWDWKFKPIPESEWTGLACVFPGDSESKYAADLGIQLTNPNGPVTAGQLAQWILDWEVKARRVDMAWEPSQDPYTLLQDFSFFYGTDVKGPNSILTQKDMMAIRNNIVEVSRGWRQLGRNKVEMLAPLVDAEDLSGGFFYLAQDHRDWNVADWPSVYAKVIQMVDSEILTFEPNGTVLYSFKRDKGFAPSLTVAFLKGSNQSCYSYFSDLTSTKRAVLDRPTLQLISPQQHRVNFTFGSNGYWGYIQPNANQFALEISGGIADSYTSPFPLINQLSYEFVFGHGVLNSVTTGSGQINYPTEVERYGQ
ncbi:hypothetical protein GCM10025858_38990 [Alicyclobacillus sacchari]|nr:hypothetical protein GCM10025858_37550 [Alicyclobacillus sacchari]GMA59396.1 hypothetical protein GCM10025858_38990 [Alicyclobacillus sacchari]